MAMHRWVIILIPSSSSKFAPPTGGGRNAELSKFSQLSLTEAKKHLSQAPWHKKEEDKLIIRCINELGLIQLDRDDSIPSDSMVNCCKRLLSYASEIR